MLFYERSLKTTLTVPLVNYQFVKDKIGLNDIADFLEQHCVQTVHTAHIPCIHQGCNVRKVISELYASFVLQCTVSGR